MTGERAGMMIRRVARAVRRAGIAEPGIRSIEYALGTAMDARTARLPDDHHPDYLHPGRTVLILLEDATIADPAVLSAGALAETLRPELTAELATTPAGAHAALAAGTLSLLGEVPAAHDGALTERLVAASHPARCIALAERLDHARHLHLRDRGEWATRHRETCDVYLPLGARTHPVLAHRLRWWCDMFARRFLGDESTGHSGA